MSEKREPVFDIEAATRKFIEATAPEAAEAVKFAAGRHSAPGGAGKLRRSLRRLSDAVSESAREAVAQAGRDIAYLASEPGRAGIAAEFGRARRDLRSVGFKTGVLVSEMRRRAAATPAAASPMAKFFNGARIQVVEGARKGIVPVALIAVIAAGVAATTGGTSAAGTAAAPAAVATSEVTFVAKDIPIEMVPSRGKVMPAAREMKPGPGFRQLAVTQLEASLGSREDAERHFDTMLAVLEACKEKSTPCLVRSAGVLLDPTVGRYSLSQTGASDEMITAVETSDGLSIYRETTPAPVDNAGFRR